MRRILVLAQLLPFVPCAQEPLLDVMSDHLHFGPAQYANAHDSADFALFRRGLTTDTTSKAGPPTSYRMVWREHQQGGFWSIARGEGSLTLPPNEDVSIHGVEDRTPFRKADGRRGLMIWHDRPCALICRSAMYYVEDGPQPVRALPGGAEE